MKADTAGEQQAREENKRLNIDNCKYCGAAHRQRQCPASISNSYTRAPGNEYEHDQHPRCMHETHRGGSPCAKLRGEYQKL